MITIIHFDLRDHRVWLRVALGTIDEVVVQVMTNPFHVKRSISTAHPSLSTSLFLWGPLV